MTDKRNMPTWVRRSIITAGIVVVLIVVAMASGHGPWRHFQPTMAEGSMS